MDNGTNGPIMALSFIAGLGALSIGGILSAIVGSLLVGIIGKSIDSLIRNWFANRNNRWRRRALAAEEQLERVKRSDDR
jgi:integral membrane sensor domain MASE1